ncbi:hypothetical protein [Aeromonas jandaei]|uniref:hypothetical protein n=1 Tax=Aeromonas jandaei TaxID=650 RepID=UPI001ADDCEAC|nr:hypothetical protein [Aeromonas jandaei]
MTADFTPATGGSPNAADYTFLWKVNGVDVGTATVGANTFTPSAAHQGQAVTVEVAFVP